MARRPIQLFATCLVEAIRPAVGLAVVRLLERAGLAVEYPEGQTCCGQPAFNAGALEDARAMARHTIDVLSRSEHQVVIPSGSCTDMLAHQYPLLLAGDPIYGSKAAALARRTRELSQLLSEGDPGASRLSRCRGKLTYHPSCHLLRGLGVAEAPLQLLRQIPGAELVALPGAEDCCGFGGLFAVKMSAISGAMLDRKLEAVAASGADTVVACDLSCLIHIEGGLRRRGSKVAARHLAEVLAEW
jgi:L-lactate dehydrogenase complex protein LldE